MTVSVSTASRSSRWALPRAFAALAFGLWVFGALVPAAVLGAGREAAPAALGPRPSAAALPALGIERDPETGGWRLAPIDLDPADAFATAMRLNQSDEGLIQVALPGGGYALDLQGRFQSWAMARVDATGRLAQGCTETPAGLACWLHSPLPIPAPPAPPEK